MLADIPGTKLYYEMEGAGPMLLCMHGGLGLDCTVFRPWLDPLADTARLVFYDHRGNGRSARPKDWSAVTHETWTSDADALVGALGGERVAVLGHSYGAFLALEFALRFPHRVSHLIICSGAPALDYGDQLVAGAKARGPAETTQAFLDALSGPWPDDAAAAEHWRRILPLYFHGPVAPFMASAFGRIRYSAAATNQSLFVCAPSYNVTERLGEIRVPTLILVGRHDLITPPAQAERLARGIKAAHIEVFEQSGHFPFVEEQHEVLSAIRRWLGRVR